MLEHTAPCSEKLLMLVSIARPPARLGGGSSPSKIARFQQLQGSDHFDMWICLKTNMHPQIQWCIMFHFKKQPISGSPSAPSPSPMDRYFDPAQCLHLLRYGLTEAAQAGSNRFQPSQVGFSIASKKLHEAKPVLRGSLLPQETWMTWEMKIEYQKAAWFHEDSGTSLGCNGFFPGRD